MKPSNRSLSNLNSNSLKHLIFHSLFMKRGVSFCTPSKISSAQRVTRAVSNKFIRRRDLFAFIKLALNPLAKMAALSVLPSKNTYRLADLFSDLYSKLWNYAEHSISHQGFDLPSALGHRPVHKVNELLCKLYGSEFASLSFGGSSGAMLTLLTAVFPKIYPQRDLILFDEVCHQSTIGGLIFGRWKAVRLPRDTHKESESTCPVRFDALKRTIELHGPKNFAAIILVLPSYDGFRSPSEDYKIYQYAKAAGIPVIIDGAWDSLRFLEPELETPPLCSICDVWISSPHKRGLTPSPLGCILTDNKSIARLWDEALDLGFRSSSVSFVDIMIAEHRLSKILFGQWDDNFAKACLAAQQLRKRISEVHPDLKVITPSDVQAETQDSTHILISTQNIPQLDARDWAAALANDFGIDVEKATSSSILLLCGSPAHLPRIDSIILDFRDAIRATLRKVQVPAHD